MGTLSLTDPQNGTLADASVIATNNSAIKTVVNGGLDDTNIHSAAGIQASKLNGYPGDGTKALFGDGTWQVPGAVAGVPVGAITMYGGTSAPSGWLLLDGSTFSTSTYSALYSVLGSGTLPDFRGRVPVTYAASGGHTDVSTMFNNDGVAVANRRPKHRHTPHSHSIAYGNVGGTPVTSLSENNNSQGTFTSGTADGGSGNSNDSLDAPAYIVVNFIIKH